MRSFVFSARLFPFGFLPNRLDLRHYCDDDNNFLLAELIKLAELISLRSDIRGSIVTKSRL